MRKVLTIVLLSWSSLVSAQTLSPEDGDTPRFMYALGVAYAEARDYARAEQYLRDAGQRARSKGQDQLLGQIETSLRKVEERVGR